MGRWVDDWHMCVCVLDRYEELAMRNEGGARSGRVTHVTASIARSIARSLGRSLELNGDSLTIFTTCSRHNSTRESRTAAVEG